MSATMATSGRRGTTWDDMGRHRRAQRRCVSARRAAQYTAQLPLPSAHTIVSHESSAGPLSRRAFCTTAGLGAAALAAGALPGAASLSALSAAELPLGDAQAAKTYPIGLELYSVRRALALDLPGTLAAVAQIGYKVVEFYAPYLQWTIPYAKDVRTQLDDLGLRCYSTHNSSAALFPGDTMSKAIEINQILGARHIIMASP